MQNQHHSTTDRHYHAYNRRIPLACRIGYVARRKLYDLFVELMAPNADSKVLDIGVTDDIESSPAANMLEQLYPNRQNLTCVGITDGALLEETYPGIRYIRITPAAPLPFAKQEFDIVYSNAVLEHVGSRALQLRFVQEACRVGKKVFIAIPNRLFPIEVHTGIPLLHLLPQPVFRALLRMVKFDFYAQEETLNYLWAYELRDMYPASRSVKSVCAGVGIGPFRSNIVSYSVRSGGDSEA